MKKKISILAIMMMAMTLWTTIGYAQDSKYWDTDVIEDTKTYPSPRTGSDGNWVYHIKTEKDLAFVAWLMNTGDVVFTRDMESGVTISIEADLDLGAHRWRGLGEGDGNGNNTKKFTGKIEGNGHTISNLYICEGNGKYNCGFIDTGGDKMQVRNLTFENCYSTIMENGSILVGELSSVSDVTFEKITFKGCRTWCDNHNGMLVGQAYKCSRLKISDITIDGAYTGLFKSGTHSENVQGNHYNGSLIGWIRESNEYVIDNVKVTNTVVYGVDYQGGIIGEHAGGVKCTIKNCLAAATFNGSRHECGGVIGKIYNGSVYITNSVVYAEKMFDGHQPQSCIGGYVGWVTNSGSVETYHDAVIGAKDRMSKTSAQCQGLFVGNNANDGKKPSGAVYTRNCYIDRAYGTTTAEIESACFGTIVTQNNKGNNLQWSDIHPYTSISKNAETVSHISMMNKDGACFGITETPIKDNGDDGITAYPLVADSLGKLFGYTYSEPQITEAIGTGILEKISFNPYNKMVNMRHSNVTTYTFKPNSDKWIVEETSTGLTGKERVDGWTFKAKPESHGKLSARLAPRPKISIRKIDYNDVRKTVTLNWTVDDYAKKDWPDAKFVIGRLYGNEMVFDTVSVDSTRWTDYKVDMVTKETNMRRYHVYFICPELKYDITESSAYTEIGTAYVQEGFKLSVESPESVSKSVVSVRAKVPNTMQLDGWRVAMLRWTTQQEDSLISAGKATSETMQSYILNNWKDFMVTEQTYHPDAKSSDDYLYAKFSDNVTPNSCSMFRYMALCDKYDKIGTDDYERYYSKFVNYMTKNSVTFRSFTASKGESTSKVKLTWDVVTKTKEDMLYVVCKRNYTATDSAEVDNESQWLEIYSVKGTSGIMTYTDETYPGYVYEYRVRAYPACESTYNSTVYDNEITDIGFSSNRGTIMGTISYNGGKTNVQGVDVRLTPDGGSLEDATPAYSMSFTGNNDCLPLAPGMGDTFWDNDWTLQWIMRPELNPNKEYRSLLTLPGRAYLQIKGDSLYMAGKRMHVTDRSWNNHIVLVHSDRMYKIGYTENPAEGKTQYTHWVDSISDTMLESYMRSQGCDTKSDTLYFGCSERQLTGNNIQMPTYIGEIDEVRLWNTVLTDDELQNTFDRYLTGAETKIRAYYTFDSGVGEYAFDSSHPSGVWSSRHTKLPGTGHPYISTIVPSSDDLTYRGTTDRNGTYQISGIPFVGEGTNYLVVPIYGTHSFQPASIRRFVSNQSLTQSDVNFTDESAFNVRIQAYYALGNYPAKGLTVLVDNVVATSEGNDVTTDDRGFVEVKVPIGEHKIALAGPAGHTMVNKGYACEIESVNSDGTFNVKAYNPTGNEGYIDVQSDAVSSLSFYDGTYVRLAGKVVGGSAEEEQPIGFGKTHANLGNAQIILEPTKDASSYALYNYGTEGSTFELSNSLPTDTLDNGNINSRTTYTSGSSVVTIDVDPTSGEYLAMLPPIPMTIKHVRTTGTIGTQLIDDDFNMSKLPPEVSFNAATLRADTLKTGTSLADFSVFKYHAKKNYIYYVDPVFNMYNPATDVSKDSLMYGDEYFISTYTDENDNEITDSVSLWSKTKRDGTSESYLVTTTDQQGNRTGHPIFSKGILYSMYMQVYEKYKNLTTGKDTLYYQKDVQITIHNNMAIQNYTNLSTGYSIDVSQVTNTIMDVPQDGIVKYDWIAGQPNPTGDHTLEMTVSYTANGNDYEGAHISGIVMGSVPIPGTDFVTAGPNNVAFVLRDPPGSASYSWIDKGSTISHTTVEENAIVTSHETSTSFKTQSTTTTYTGTAGPAAANITVSLSHKNDNYTENAGGLSVAYTYAHNNAHTLTFTATDKIQTSGSDSYVGANGDVYIGTSRNMTFAKCNTLGFAQQEKSDANTLESKYGKYYALSQGESVAKSDSFTTLFTYSQKHIVNELIPELKRLRHFRVNKWVDNPATYTPNASELKANAVYYVAKTSIQRDNPKDEKDVWESDNDYKAFVPTNGKTYSINSSDTINLYSVWIQGWNDAIKENEQTKYETQTKFKSIQEYQMADNVKGYYGFLGNESLDAGNATSKTITRTSSSSKSDTHNESEMQNLVLSGKFNTLLWFIGKENKTKYTGKTGHSGKHGFTTANTNTQSFGYYMHDNKYGNVLSVDTYLPGELTGNGTFTELNSTNSRAKFDDFFVFRVRGGQTKCPYQPTETSLQYKVNGSPVNLGDGTIAIEDPKIEIVDHDIMNVASGQSAFTKIKLSNRSAATVSTGCVFNVMTRQKSSPDGLQMYIDGNVVGQNTGNQVILMPGESVTKTLEIRQSNEQILDYKNIMLQFASDCEAGRMSVDSFTVHFKAASSPVKLVQMDNVVNTVNSTDSSVIFRISGYDVTRKGFAGVRLKYKKQRDLNFSTYKILIADSLRYYDIVEKFEWDDTHMKLDKTGTNPLTEVKVKMGGWDDGTYQFIAESFTPYSKADEARTYSDTLSVLKDTRRPEQLTAPSPSNGYYSIGDEISLQMNEDMQMENVTAANNIEVTAVLNDAKVTHLSGLHFDGNKPARSSSRVQILSNDAAFAFWYKPQIGKTSCLLSQTLKGSDNRSIPFKIMYNDDATMSVWIDNVEYKSERHAYLTGTTKPVNDWMYCIYKYELQESGKGVMRLYNLFGTSTEAESRFITQENLSPSFGTVNVPLYVGGSEQKDPCYADMEGLVVYEDVQTFETMAADKENKHIGNTRGLLAYWPMDEGYGLTAHDRVRSRDLTLNGTDNWYLPVTNYALNLDEKGKYMAIKTNHCPIGKNDDYSLEFWFRSLETDLSAGQEMTMFSNGLGAGDDLEVQNANHASLSLGSDGQIILRAAGQTREMGEGYNDGQWHYLAMNVQRDSYVTIMVDTVDITTSATIEGKSLGGFSNSEMVIGAMKYVHESQSRQPFIENYFIGQIDDVRLWKAYRTNASIKGNAYTRLKGNEAGLVAYYPFEKSTVVSGQSLTQSYLGDCVQNDTVNGVFPADTSYIYGFDESLAGQSLADAATADNGPRLRAANIMTPVDINFTTNGKDKIVFTFPDDFPKDRIEGCVVNFRVKNMKDIAGNPMRQPVVWSVYVNQNPLIWDCSNPSVIQELGTKESVELHIYNNSYETQTWNISGVPSWATLDKTTGTVAPFGSETVTLTTAEGTPTGFYQSILYLVGNENIYAPLGVFLSVTNVQPDWKVVETTGEKWMTIFGRLKINNNWDDDENDIVGMFDESGRCLALASPTYYKDQDAHFVNLNVKGNADDVKKKLTFRIWDASTGIIYDGADVEYYIGNKLYTDNSQIFNNCAVLGSFSRPYVISAGKTICQTMNLHKGWNWVSLWVTPQNGNTSDIIFGSVSDKISEIKSRTRGVYAKNFSNLKIFPANSYHIFMDEDATLSIEGEKVDPSTVEMKFDGVEEEGAVNYHWLGFPLWQTMTLSEAFADFKPTTDDIIKSEDAYAMYNGKAWIGNLKFLSPGMGYIYGYHANKGATWNYPDKVKGVGSMAGQTGFSLGVSEYGYEDYTFVDVTVVDSKNQTVSGTNYQLGAFCEQISGTETTLVCRGVADGDDEGAYPISIFGNDGETFSFKLFNKSDGKTYDLVGTKDFDNITSPQHLTLKLFDLTGINTVNVDTEDEGVNWYNTGGARVDKDLHQHGVFIKNGKKIGK